MTNHNIPQLKFTLTEGSRGMFDLKMHDSLSNRELCKLLFDEINEIGSTKISRIKIVDLLTRERSGGYGTAAVNYFIDYCKKHYPPSILAYGLVYHQEHVYHISQQDKEFYRNRRNGFWQKFGFNITLNKVYEDRMEAKISDLLILEKSQS